MTLCAETGKIIHRTAGHAHAAIVALEANGKGSPDMNVYRCGDHWHIGHSRTRFVTRIRRSIAGGRSPSTTYARNRRRKR